MDVCLSIAAVHGAQFVISQLLFMRDVIDKQIAGDPFFFSICVSLMLLTTSHHLNLMVTLLFVSPLAMPTSCTFFFFLCCPLLGRVRIVFPLSVFRALGVFFHLCVCVFFFLNTHTEAENLQ